MKNLKIIFLFTLLLSFGNPVIAKEWEGIIPLHSTRKDVERLLKDSILEKRCNYSLCTYYLKDVNVHISYSEGDCKSGGSKGWDVPPDTVLSIAVSLKTPIALSDLQLDIGSFKRWQDPHIEDHIYYTDEANGFSLSVDKERNQVYSLTYVHTERDRNLRCAK